MRHDKIPNSSFDTDDVLDHQTNGLCAKLNSSDFSSPHHQPQSIDPLRRKGEFEYFHSSALIGNIRKEEREISTVNMINCHLLYDFLASVSLPLH